MKPDFDSWVRKLALGTVQFGLNYGISNPAGKVSQEEVAAILDSAYRHGIDTLDTAVSYGNSEEAIGRAMAETRTSFEIVSKIPPDTRPEQIREIVKGSLLRLHSQRIKAFLTHQFKLFQQPKIRNALDGLKAEGLMAQTGVSVYYPDQVQWLLDSGIDFDIVQLPFNIFDRRFRTLFPALKERGVEIHIRSVFLQGLFFLDPEQLTDPFQPVRDPIRRLRSLSTETGIPLPVLLLNDVILEKSIDKVIIGVTSERELKENLNAFSYLDQSLALKDELDTFSITDEQILIPPNWKTT